MTKLEQAARKLCEIRGLDPDERVGHGVDPRPGDTFVPDVMCYSPRWQRVAREVRAINEVNQALGGLWFAHLDKEVEE